MDIEFDFDFDSEKEYWLDYKRRRNEARMHPFPMRLADPQAHHGRPRTIADAISVALFGQSSGVDPLSVNKLFDRLLPYLRCEGIPGFFVEYLYDLAKKSRAEQEEAIARHIQAFKDGTKNED